MKYVKMHLLLFLSFKLCAQEISFEIETFAKIKSYTIYKQSKGKRNPIEKRFFLENGLVNKIQLYREGRVSTIRTYFYHDTLLKRILENNLINKTHTSYLYEYDINTQKLVLEKEIDGFGKVLMTKKYEYYGDSTNIYSQYSSQELNLYTIEKIFFLKRNPFLTEAIFYLNKTNNIGDSTFFKYDLKGRLLEKDEYMNNDLRKTYYKYDSLNRIVSVETRRSDNSIAGKRFNYFSEKEQSSFYYSFKSPVDSFLVRKKKIKYDNRNKKTFFEDLNFFNTSESDRERLSKGTGYQFYYNNLGTGKVVRFEDGKPLQTYGIEYRIR